MAMKTLSLRHLNVRISLVAGALLLFSGCSSMTQLTKESRVETIAHVPGSAIKVSASNGSIKVIKADRGDVKIASHLRLVSPLRSEDTRVVADRNSDGILEVRVDWAEGKKKNREGCSFEIEVPDGSGIELRTSNGAIALSGLEGKASLNTSNGKIDVSDHRGPLNARTSNGTIVVRGIDGPVDLKSSNGRISVDEVGGSVKAITSNGGVGIAFDPGSQGSVEARSSNGSITLNISSNFSGELYAKARNGAVRTENLPEAQLISLGKNEARLKFGNSTETSTVTTSNGSIKLVGM